MGFGHKVGIDKPGLGRQGASSLMGRMNPEVGCSQQEAQTLGRIFFNARKGPFRIQGWDMWG